MLVTFMSKAHQNITMFGDVAIQLIKMMGHSGTVPSAILAAQVPEALKKLTEALENEKQTPKQNTTSQESDEEDSVSLRHRALPLLELLREAAQQKCDVLWK